MSFQGPYRQQECIQNLDCFLCQQYIAKEIECPLVDVVEAYVKEMGHKQQQLNFPSLLEGLERLLLKDHTEGLT
jgi:hypothetical protein